MEHGISLLLVTYVCFQWKLIQIFYFFFYLSGMANAKKAVEADRERKIRRDNKDSDAPQPNNADAHSPGQYHL